MHGPLSLIIVIIIIIIMTSTRDVATSNDYYTNVSTRVWKVYIVLRVRIYSCIYTAYTCVRVADTRLTVYIYVEG